MKISIITVNFNNKEGLQKTVNSVLHQTWRDFEWIIIDGGSSDGSKELIEQVAADPTSNITYWCSEKDNGVYNAMNKGISHAHGMYLNFMNSGDCYYSSNTLRDVFSKEIVADVIYGDVVVILPNENRLVEFPAYINLIGLWSGGLNHQCTFIKRELFDRRQYDENYRIAADYKFWIECAMHGATFRHVAMPIANYDNEGQSSAESLTQEEYKQIHQEVIPKDVLLYLQENSHESDMLRWYYEQGLDFEWWCHRKWARRILKVFTYCIRKISSII